MVELPRAHSGRGAFDAAVDAAISAGEVIKARFRGNFKVRSKGKSNLVTDVDLLAEHACLEILRTEFPDHLIVSEESHPGVSVEGYAWVIDPLDGTNNYVFGIPFFCVNIALVKDDDILLGVTYDPLTKEMFHAISDGGAYLNGRAIHVADKQSLEKGLVGFDIGYNVGKSEMTLELARMLRAKVHSLRVLGSASLGLAYVACGRFDVYFHPYLYPWDVASGLLLVSEAGGLVTDWSGQSAGIMGQEFIAGNEAMHTQFAGFLNSD